MAVSQDLELIDISPLLISPPPPLFFFPPKEDFGLKAIYANDAVFLGLKELPGGNPVMKKREFRA